MKIIIIFLLVLSNLIYGNANEIISFIKDSGINNINVKKAYHENTDFDNFYDKKTNVALTKKDMLLLQLESMEYGTTYAQYTLNLSVKFTTIIFSYETEMELKTILVNYNSKGEKVATIQVAYDEVAESAFKMTSTISKNNITVVDESYWDYPTSYTTNTYKIKSDGKIKEIK